MMIRILFVLSPVFLGGLCMLIGETFNWAKKRQRETGTMRMTFLSHSRRK